MRKIVLYIAVSVDGYIAKTDGDVGWLDATPNPDMLDYGYYSMYESIDTTLMGNATYQLLLSWDVEFPYKEKTNYIFSRSSHEDTEYVSFVKGDVVSFLKELKETPGKDIWLIGGAQLNTLLLDNDLIDKMIITTLPMVLGAGIPLFNGSEKDVSFKLTKIEQFDTGVYQTTYEK